MASTGLKRQTMSAALTDELRERILNLDIPEGEQLRQDTLAAEFGVSRIPVREALLQLEGEGLVTLSAHKGYTVTALSLDEIRELFDLRALIEVDLLQRAIPRLETHHIERAREILATFDEMLSRGSQERDWGQLNWELHAVLYEPAERPRALSIVRNLHRNADRYLRLQLKLTQRTNERAREEHNRLVNLCADRDVIEASRLLNEHVLAARDDLLAFLAERRGSGENTHEE
ncbi:GntR family transcriptional regulator [Arhodomonas aquaeolei]|nr:MULTISPECIES: GntR family transcriptional regulator [Arhodomonas]MCS4503083.1 GntR family transcriptional regulator [Arhodomonas aquaeolei]